MTSQPRMILPQICPTNCSGRETATWVQADQVGPASFLAIKYLFLPNEVIQIFDKVMQIQSLPSIMCTRLELRSIVSAASRAVGNGIASRCVVF